MALSFRSARDADLDRLVAIHVTAFPDGRDGDARRQNFLSNVLGGFEHLHVAERDGVVVAHAFLFPLECFYGGARVRVSGIASVAVAPEARGSGIAGALLEHLHELADRNGSALTLLYAFRQGFYARHGYAPTTPTKRLIVAPQAIPRVWWQESEQVDVRAAAKPDYDDIARVYELAAAQASGWVVRRKELWARRFADPRRAWFVAECGGALLGYACARYEQREAHAMTRMVVQELATIDERARRRLLGLLGAQRDQVSEIELELAAGDTIDVAFTDIDDGRFGTAEVEHSLGALVGGAMVRIVDVRRALEARAYGLDDGVLTLRIGGASGPLRLQVRAGRGQVFAGEATQPLRMDRRALAATLYGGLSVCDAERLGWVTGGDGELLQHANALFALGPYLPLDRF